jgi:hypothetical protein
MSKKKIFWSIFFGIFFACLVFTPLFWSINKANQNQKVLIENNDKLLKEQLVTTTCSSTRDSLARINFELSKYKTLTQAMLHRDEATSQLKHKVGDVVIMKNDSARVVIEDVLIGGGKYNHYVKFKVLYKDQTTKEVTPELIF